MNCFTKFILTVMSFIPVTALAQTSIEHTDSGFGVYDKESSKWIIQDRYDKIKTVFDVSDDDICYACQKKGKYALFTKTGKLLTFFAFDDVRSKKLNNFLIVEQDEKWGMINTQGYVVMPFKYKAIAPQKERIACSLATEVSPSDIPLYRIKLMEKAAISRGDKYLYDANLNHEIAETLSKPDPATEKTTYAIRETESTKSFQVSDLSKLRLSPCLNGYMVVREDNTKTTYIFDKGGNNLGRLKTLDNKDIFFSKDGRAIVQLENGDVAIVNTSGSVIKNIGKAFYSSFVDGISCVVSKGQVLYINTNGEQVCPQFIHQFDAQELLGGINLHVYPLSEDRRQYSFYGEKGFLDQNGKTVISGDFCNTHKFSEGLASVSIKDGNQELWGFINKGGDFIIPAKFSYEPGDFCDGYALVRKRNGSFCYINTKGEVCSEEYSKAGSFYQGYAIVQTTDRRMVVIDRQFNFVKETGCAGWLCEKDSGCLIQGNVIYTTMGEPVATLSKLMTYNFSEGLSAEISAGKGYINTNGEWVLYFTQNEF